MLILSKLNFDWLNVRLHGMRSFLLKKEQYELLIHQSSIDQVVNLLLRTNYNQHIQSNYLNIQPVRTLNKAIIFYFRDQLKKIEKMSGQPYSEWISWILRYWDLLNIKIVIKMINNSIPIDQRRNYLATCYHCLPIGDLSISDISDLYDVENFDSLKNILNSKNSPFYNVLEQITGNDVENKDWYIENQLNKFYYSKIINILTTINQGSILNSSRENPLLTLAQEEIDFENMKIALRWIRTSRFDPSSTIVYPPKDIFIPGGGKFNIQSISDFLENGYYQKIIETIGKFPFAKISISDIYKEMDIQTLDYETILEREFIRYQIKKKFNFTSRLNVLISYYYNLIAELRNLETVIYGIHSRIDPKLLTRRIIYV